MHIPLPTLLSLPFIALGYFCLRTGSRKAALSRASKRWPAVHGTVQSLTVVHAGDAEFGLRPQFYVRYFYDIAGQRYWGDWKSPAAATVESARKKCGLEEGGSFPIYYCPEDPGLSVVIRGRSIDQALLPAAGVFFIAVPVLVAIVELALD